jgi:hypothetical protein
VLWLSLTSQTYQLNVDHVWPTVWRGAKNVRHVQRQPRLRSRITACLQMVGFQLLMPVTLGSIASEYMSLFGEYKLVCLRNSSARRSKFHLHNVFKQACD